MNTSLITASILLTLLMLAGSTGSHANEAAKEAAIVIKRFDIAGAKLGKTKHRDTALAMAKAAPHLLAVDIVEFLRRDGFRSVVLDETDAPANPDAIVLTGRFTELSPGSQALRVWIGFGAGHSNICTAGELRDGQGKSLDTFEICNAGIGWGDSGANLDDEAQHLGQKVAEFVATTLER